MDILKKFLRKFVPQTILYWYRQPKYAQKRQSNSLLTTQEVFTKIYRNNDWGGNQGEFCSGSGSDEILAKSYCEKVKEFIVKKSIQSIVDLGCGDFIIGKNLQVNNVSYIGIDIVKLLIDRNNNLFSNEKIDFVCLDIINDDLPNAELCLIRQVLQHLSNEQILKILKKIKQYKYVIITEHYPAENVTVRPNIDKPHGEDTRIIDNSAVYLDKPPFNLLGIQAFLEVKVDKYISYEGEQLKSFLIDNTQ